MKKTICFLLIVFLVTGCFSSEYLQIKDEAKQISYIEEHKLNKNDAYVEVCEWMAKNFGSSKDAIQMQDKESGTIIVSVLGTYTAHWLPAPIVYPYNYTLSIKIKENKIKFEFVLTPHEYNYYPDDRASEQVQASFKDVKNSVLSYLNDTKRDSF